MPLAMMTPEMAQSLVSIGLPYGPNTKRGLIGVASGPGGPPLGGVPDAATQSMNLSAQLNANPQTNGSQANQGADPQAYQASQQDAAAIFSGSQPAPGQAARLQAAQAAAAPAPSYLDTLRAQAAQATEAPQGPVVEGEGTPAVRQGLSNAVDWAKSQAAGAVEAPQLSAAARLQAAQAAAAQQTTQDREAAQNQEAATAPATAPAATPATAPAATPAGAPSGAPQAPQATTPPAAAQTPPVTPPGPAQGPVATPPAPVAPKGPVSVEDISNAIYSQESGSGRNTKTSPTGAVGGMQIEPATWKQYAQPGEDINNPTDNRNVGNRIVQDLYQKAGGDPARVAVGYFSGAGNIAPPGAPTPWITDKTDGHTSVSQYVASVTAKLGQPGQFTGATTSNTEYAPSHAQADGSAIGINPDEMMKLATAMGYKPVDQSAANNRNLIAMGLGMMGGRTYADSMKNAAGIMSEGNNAILGVQEKANSNALGLAQAGLADRRLQAQMAMQNVHTTALMSPKQFGTPLVQRAADGKETAVQGFRDGYGNVTYQPVPGLTAAMVRENDNRTGVTASATAGAKEASKDFEEINDAGNNATSKLQQINAVQKQLDSGQVSPGPAAAARLKTAVGNWLGVTIDGASPEANQMLTQAISAARGNGIMGKNMRTQREFDTVMQGALNFDGQNPQVLQNTLNAMRNVELAKQGMQKRLLADPNVSAIRSDPIAMAKFQQSFLSDWSDQQNAQGGINNPQPGTVIHYDATGKPITQ